MRARDKCGQKSRADGAGRTMGLTRIGAARRTAAVAACIFVSVQAQAAQTITYTYDALGRLDKSEVSGGPGGGVIQDYAYDAAGNRSQYVVTGAAQNSVTLSIPSPVANSVSSGVALSVNINGLSPSGMVTFTEGGVLLGSTWVIDGTASLFLEGFPHGVHQITVTY